MHILRGFRINLFISKLIWASSLISFEIFHTNFHFHGVLVTMETRRSKLTKNALHYMNCWFSKNAIQISDICDEFLTTFTGTFTIFGFWFLISGRRRTFLKFLSIYFQFLIAGGKPSLIPVLKADTKKRLQSAVAAKRPIGAVYVSVLQKFKQNWWSGCVGFVLIIIIYLNPFTTINNRRVF